MVVSCRMCYFCWAKLCSSLQASLGAGRLVTRSRVCLWCGGVLLSQAGCACEATSDTAGLCGAPGSECAAALPCSAFPWSMWFTPAWTWWRAHTAGFGQSHSPLQHGEWGGGTSSSLILQHLSALRGKNRDEKKSNPFADFPCISAQRAAPAETAAHQYLTQIS